MQHQIYAGLEGNIQRGFAVCRQGHDAAIILEHAKEDFKALAVVGGKSLLNTHPTRFGFEGTLLHINVTFIKEKDSVSFEEHI